MLTIGESEFTCERADVKRAPGGVPTACAGVKEVYKATNLRDRIPGPLEKPPVAKVAPSAAAAAATPAAVVHLPQPITRPLPIMEPAQVARIWVNYWIDNKGDLHQPGLIYTEVTARRWALGQPAHTGTRDLQPLQVMGETSTQVSGESLKNDLAGFVNMTPPARSATAPRR